MRWRLSPELLESTLVKWLDLAFNCIDACGFNGLLEACGGCDQPFLDLTVEGNPSTGHDGDHWQTAGLPVSVRWPE
eukprot:3670074-Heterocapsa_arctica.AAC.1